MKLKNLKKMREKRKVTQLKLSVDIEVSQELISQYELGKSLPTIPNLIKLANYFNCSTDYLLGLTDNPNKIKNLDSKDVQLNNVIEIYNSLSPENKNKLTSYITYLFKEQN